MDNQDIVWLSDFGANATLRFDRKTEQFTVHKSTSHNASVRQILGRPGELWLPAGGWITNPGSGQERLYGPNGKPEVDIDWDHDHGQGQGQPHPHNWGQDGREVPEGGFSPWPRGRGNPVSCPK